MALDQHVIDITIRLGSPTISRAGLGTPLLAGAATFASDVIRRYTEQDDYAGDTELTTDLIAMITRIFAQSDHVSTVAVGKIRTDVAQEVNLTINTSAVGKFYGITLFGTDYTYEGTDTSPATVSAALKVLIDAGAHPVTVTDNTGDLDITADVAGDGFSYATPTVIDGDQTITLTTANRSIETELSDIEAVDSDWYAVIPESRDALQITRAVEWVTSQSGMPRTVWAQTSDADVPTSATDDLASLLEASAYGRSILTYHPTDDDKVASGWAGFVLAANPDSESTIAAYKTITGVMPAPPTTTERGYLLAKNANFYSTLYGVGAMYDGKCGDGHFVDERIIADWFAIRLGENLAQLLLDTSNRNEKIPFTDPGIATVGSVAQALIDKGTRVGHFVPGSPYNKVTLPSIDQSSSNPVDPDDRAARHLVFTASAQLAGAIQTVAVTVDLVI